MQLTDSSFIFSTLLLVSHPPFSISLPPMVPELEKPGVTEIQVRMDCNGCVQKIRKALHGIHGIYDLCIDFPQQKLTVIGWADPEKIVKAIRKTRKIATICSHIEPSDPSAAKPTEPPQQPLEGGPQTPAPETANPPLAEPAPAAEPLKDPPPAENPPPEPTPSPVAAETNANQPAQAPGPKDVGEVHFIRHHPPDYGYRYDYGHCYSGHWNRYPGGHGLPPEPRYPNSHGLPPEPRYTNGRGVSPVPLQPIYVTHSYNTYRPSPYVTEYEYIRSPPHHTVFSRMDHYSEDYRDNTRNGNITSIFSDENPNACRVM